MQPERLDPPPPFNGSMHVNIQFHHKVTLAENMDAATALVRSQIELFLNKARHEAQQLGIEMRCDYVLMGLQQSLENAVAKQPRVVLVHGIHSAEGTTNMRRLVPYFETAGFRVVVFEYGWLGVLRARWANPGIARRLASVMRPNDHLVCHSNGAAVAWLAMRDHGMRCRHATLIAPALDDDKALPHAIWTDVLYNPCDHVVWLARWLWDHAWGSMGRDGCTDARALAGGTTNIDVAHHAALPQICGHLEYFAPYILPRLGPWIVRRHLERA